MSIVPIVTMIQVAAFSSMMSQQSMINSANMAQATTSRRSRLSPVSTYNQPAEIDPVAKRIFQQPEYIRAVSAISQADFDAAKPGDIIGGPPIFKASSWTGR